MSSSYKAKLRAKPFSLSNVNDLNQMMNNNPNFNDLEAIAWYVNHGGNLKGFQSRFAQQVSNLKSFFVEAIHLFIDNPPTNLHYLDYLKLDQLIAEADDRDHDETVYLLAALQIKNDKNNQVGILFNSDDITEEDYETILFDIKRNSLLTRFGLSGKFDMSYMGEILEFPKIKELTLFQADIDGYEGYHLLAKYLTYNQTLRSLSILDDPELTVAGVERILGSLKNNMLKLEIVDCPNIAGSGLALMKFIARSPQLTTLSLTNLNLTDLGLVNNTLSENNSLTRINIETDNSEYTDVFKYYEERNQKLLPKHTVPPEIVLN